MSNQQVEAILKYLCKDDIMLEYGSGGSTLFFYKYVKKYYSLEHEPTWYNKIADKVKDIPSLYYHHVMPNYGNIKDPGCNLDTIFDKHGEWCISKEDYEKVKAEYPYAPEGIRNYSSIGRYLQFRDYVNYIDKLGVDKFDKVLIDGRARTFCSYKILPYLHKNSIVFIDDFYNPSYGDKTRGDVAFGGDSFFDRYEKIEQVDHMLIVRKK